MDSVHSECPIWGTPASELTLGHRHIYGIDSPRAGGEYLIAHGLAQELLKHALDEATKAKLTTWLIDERWLGNQRPEVTRKAIENARAAQRISVPDRADRVLRCLAQKLEKEETGTLLAVDGYSDYPHWTGEDAPGKAYLELLAHLESPHPTKGGLMALLWELEREGLIGRMALPGGSPGQTPSPLKIPVTVPGFKRAKDLAQAVNTADDRVFVAMWFHESTEEVWKKGIGPAIRAAGYEPVLVKEQHFTGPIVDQIISEIRRSRFIVVDYTHGKAGARGSVYYEAGFAYGLDKEVISTCRDTILEKVHFDTQQHNHIAWVKGKEEELKTKLRDRITAVMGDGPLKGQKSER